MKNAATALPGLHDFVAFTERPREQPETRVRVHRVEIVDSGDLVLVRLVASHFLWKMVRRVIGALARVGGGDLAVEAFASLVDGTAPPKLVAEVATWTAPPSGLFLERVLYPGEPDLGPPLPVSPVSRERISAHTLFVGTRGRTRGAARRGRRS